jgi:hypothetical protein
MNCPDCDADSSPVEWTVVIGSLEIDADKMSCIEDITDQCCEP